MPAFPPRRPPRKSSPASTVLCRHSDFLSPFPPRLLSLAWRYHLIYLGNWSPGSQSPGFGGGERTSQVSGEPPCVHALLLDPDGISTPGHLRRFDTAFRQSDGVGSRDNVSLRGSITRPTRSLCTLHVLGYPSPRNTRFRLPATLCRVGLHTHWVPAKGFERVLTTFPRLFLAHQNLRL